MAYATHSDGAKIPPPYGFYNETNSGVSYQQVPPPVYSPNLGSPPTGVYIQPPVVNVVTGTPFLSRHPMTIQCPQCRQQVVTGVQYESGGGTWLISLGICIFGGIFGCCLIPFCINECKDAVHICPACNNYIGRRNFLN